ncbi:MAG: long-chain fatty acid--CoA ligase [Desulfobacteraceae bacterium]|nr:long-chain fatty acid--CoA ligase [Desulfobacteraceae bacterium]
MNLSDIIKRGAVFFPESRALIFEGLAFSYKELNACINSIAAYLQELGVSKGDRIALYAENRPEWIMTYYGIVRLGAIAVCISASYKGAELEHQVNDSGAVYVVTSESLSSNLPLPEKMQNLKGSLIIEKDNVFSGLNVGGTTEPDSDLTVDCEPDDTCVVLYTGGTTGVPKGAMLTHRNLLYTAGNVCFHERLAPCDRSLCFMPLNHVFASNHIMNAGFYACATIVLHRGFDMDKIVSSISSNQVTRMYAVPTVYIRILNNPDCHSHLRSVQYSFSAATSMPTEIVRQWQNTFGLNIYEAYGLTETASLVTYNHIFQHKVGAVGSPAGLVEVKLVDADGKEVPGGEEGEIVVRGPNIMKGYLNHPEETANTIVDGWLHSGDVGRFDESGYLYIVDRLKDLIISGGLNVYPREVEEVIYTHEAVEECSVVGLSHPEYGEAVTAFIRLRKGRDSVAEEDLIDFCKERMASYKAPKKVYFLEDFPRTPQGKILKRELKRQNQP